MGGERLTRDEAFDLLRRTIASLASGDSAVRAGVVRAKARQLLGRDSESLSDRNFPRILKDAHDNDVIDLRRRGDDFEIARVAEPESVSDQLVKSATSNAPVAPAAAPVPRGMGPRGGVSTRGRVGRPGAPPADLLKIGVVGQSSSAVTLAVPAPAAEPAATVTASHTPSPSATAPAEGVAKKRGRQPALKSEVAVEKAPPAKAASAKKKVAAAPVAKKTVAAKKPRAKKATAASAA